MHAATARRFSAIGALEHADKLLADATDALTFILSNLADADDGLDVAPHAPVLRLLVAQVAACQHTALAVLAATDADCADAVVPLSAASRN